MQAYTAGRERLNHFPHPPAFFPFPTSSLPNKDTVKDHFSAGNLPMSFPQSPLKGKPGVVGKSPKHLGKQSYGTRHRYTEASAGMGRTWLHSSCCGHTETRLAGLFRPECSSLWLNQTVKTFCVHFLAWKGSKDNASSILPLTHPFGKLHSNYCQCLQGAKTVSGLQLNRD